ncbi:hypothetical protein AC578_10975 [Pseudocercospora eumusae]|uniref:Uncharacterized protein n=1 Tax=Pseudocercospora eumusae TaxID=321146 RepID=A0A139HSQ7_9PEZI|nr:hypothetical protein AC578_10975 [Pseudocercospora eumusae]
MFSLIQDPKRLRQEDLSTGVRIEDLTQPLNRTYHMAIMTPEILLGDASTAESGTSCQDFVGRIPVIISIARCTVGKSAFHRAPRSLKPLTRRKVAHSLVEVAQSVGRSQEKKSCVFGFSVLRAALPLLLFLLFHSVWRRSFSSSPSIRLADLQHLFRQDWEGGHGINNHMAYCNLHQNHDPRVECAPDTCQSPALSLPLQRASCGHCEELFVAGAHVVVVPQIMPEES